MNYQKYKHMVINRKTQIFLNTKRNFFKVSKMYTLQKEI